jgi:small subunit ribosomal protein S2
MILRRAIWAGARATARSTLRPLRRSISTEVESIESSAQNSLKQLQSIHAQLNAEGDRSVPAVNPETHGTSAPANDNVAEQYHLFKQQGKFWLFRRSRPSANTHQSSG